MTEPLAQIPKLLLTPEEAAAALGISRTRLYAFMAGGVIESVLIGHSRRVPVGALEDYVARLRDQAVDTSGR
jgi:excisionase family DNA binding protein